MRRYWKLAVLVPFIVLGISTFYVDASASNKPDYYLETRVGNAQIAANVQLQATVPQPGGVSIGTNGSEYQTSFWASLDANYYPNSLRNLAKEYPQFMRGKQNPYGFYVDKRVIGYVNLESQRGGWGISLVNVSVYNKMKKTSSSFTFALPNTTLSIVGVLVRVVVIGKTMKFLTLNYNAAGVGQVIHLYTIDLNQKRVVSNQTILSAVPLINQVTLGVVNYTDALKQASNYTIFSENPIHSHTPLLQVYDIQSGKVSEIKNSTINHILKNEPKAQLNQVGNQLYVISQSKAKGQWRIVQYDLAKKNIRSDFTFSLHNFISHGGVVNLAKIRNHRLYMVATSNPSLAIIDLGTGRVLYQGVVVRKDKKKSGNVGIYNMSLN